jgi:hypothetical protein
MSSLDRIQARINAREHQVVLDCGRRHRATWAVLQRNGNRSAFSGYHWTPSDYSAVRCGECGRVWRTKAAYVSQLPDDTDLHPSRYFSSHPDCTCRLGVKGTDPECGMHGHAAGGTLRAHVHELHQRISPVPRDEEALVRAHGHDHHHYGGSHHHGPTAGPHARPAGWRTGEGVVMREPG